MSDILKARLIIIGGGPAGYTAAIYAARSGHQTLLIQGPQPGGQLMTTTDVDNYPGFAQTIQGPALMAAMQEQAVRMGVQMISDSITRVDLTQKPFHIFGDTQHYQADSLILATGAQARWLGIPSEATFRGHGVSACATCDGFFFRGQDVTVIGGGNTAVEEAIFLAAMARSVTLIHRRDTLRAERVLQDTLFNHSKITVRWNAVVQEIQGTQDPKEVTGLVLRDTQTQELSHLPTQGVFVAIGHTPMTAPFKDQIQVDHEGYIVTQPGSTLTSVPGVFAAGDVQDKIYRQAITAAGQGCMAALDADRYLSLHAC